MNQIEHLSQVMDFVYDKLQQPSAAEFEQVDEKVDEKEVDEINLINAISNMSKWGWSTDDVIDLAKTLGVKDETP